MTTYPEDRVLEPLDPVPDDVNDWPDFALREVKIFHQGKGRYADLLEASDETPLCVLGELMPLDDELEHLALIDNPVYARIKIDNVTNYSFGQDDSGKPVMWAAGKAGWHEISPSDRYLSYYNDTVEAIDLFYFMVDQHQKLPKKRQRLGFVVDPFLTEYQKHTGYRINDDDEAMETIHKHHKFLLKQMVEEREGIDWSQTHLWKHLLDTYAGEVETLRATLAAQMDVSYAEPDDEAEPGESDEEASSEADSESTQADEEESETTPSSSAKSSSESTDESESEPDEAPVDYTKPIWDLLTVLRKTPTFDIRSCGIEKLADELRKTSAFPNDEHKAAVRAIERAAPPLLRLMNEAKLRKKFNWSTRAIYVELEATLADEIAHEIKTPAPKMGGGKGNQRHRMKSVLRPSGAGSKARKRTRGVGDSQDEDEIMTDADADADADAAPTLGPVAKRNGPSQFQQHLARRVREPTADSATSREDSPSRQLNGTHGPPDPYGLPELAPPPEAQEMLELVSTEAKRVGRQHQTANLRNFLEGLGMDF